MSKLTCDNGLPCIFMSKDIGWKAYDPSVETSLGIPFPPTSTSWNNSDTTLYVTISSFRDKLCPITLYNLYTKALYPNRITLGVIQQNLDDDIDCLDNYCQILKGDKEQYDRLALLSSDKDCPFRENIRIDKVNAYEAKGIIVIYHYHYHTLHYYQYSSSSSLLRQFKGPTWARARGSLLLKDEEFCMQIDSHMDFVKKWDVKMMNMWALTNNEYGILSTYVAASEQLKFNEDSGRGMNNMHEVPHLCMVTFYGSYGLIRNWGTKCARALPKPKLTNAIWGAGLSFSKCHAERKVPYDPHTPFIFDGEEFSRAVRFFTYGYDIYTPHRVFVVHNYKDSQSDPKHMSWSVNEQRERSDSTIESVKRLKMLLGYKHDGFDDKNILEVHQSKYGLGDRRTLEQAIKFSGVDTANLVSLGNYCGNIAYIPFIEHPFGPDYIPKYDPITLKYDDVRDPSSIYFNKSDTESITKWINAKTKYEQLHSKDKDNINIEAPTFNNNQNIHLHRNLNHPNPNLDHTANYILIIVSIGMFLLATNWRYLMKNKKAYEDNTGKFV